MRPCFVELALFFLLLTLAGCNGSGAGSAAKSETKFDPCEGLRELNPHCGWTPHWYDTGVSTNAIDGTKTEHLMLESIDPDGMDYGRLHYAELKICFKNGKLCGGDIVGVGVTVHGMVSPLSYDSHHRTPVRLKFDDERPARETWGISDDKETLFPYGHEKQFLSELITHRKLILEFSYYEKAPTTITFELSGLGAQMKTAGLQDPTPELEATRKAKAVRQSVEEKRLDGLRAECASFVDGSPEMIHAKKMPLPPKKCREVLPWMRDAYLTALYELQEQSH